MEALTFCKFQPSRSSQISNLDLMCSVIKLSLQHICSFPFGHTMLLVLPTPWGFIMSYTLPFQFSLTLIINKSVLTNHILSGLRSFLELWLSLLELVLLPEYLSTNCCVSHLCHWWVLLSINTKPASWTTVSVAYVCLWCWPWGTISLSKNFAVWNY